MTAATTILADYITSGNEGPRDNTPSANLVPLVVIDCELNGMVCRFELHYKDDQTVRAYNSSLYGAKKVTNHSVMMSVKQADGRVSSPRVVSIEQAQQSIDTYKGAVTYTAKMGTNNNAPLARL